MKKIILFVLMIATGCQSCPRNTLRCNNNAVEICNGTDWIVINDCNYDGFVCCDITYGTEQIESCATQEVCNRHANR